ncbi:MAG TPA: phosphate ABC transporter permease subunit PstC, partial [Verrucomicrobiae bacterium]|nr:phosphate ABC transporter permease subunit PstC [Verrucomicrobiae bacterium]
MKATGGVKGNGGRLRRKAWRHAKERLIEALLFLSAASCVAITFAIVAILVGESLPFFREVPLRVFLTDTQWTPLFSDPHYGILPLASGTLVTTAVALLVAIPLGTTIAIYLSEFAPKAVRQPVAFLIGLLAAIPSVVYGLWGI